MNSQPNRQNGAARALVQLTDEFPGLPIVEWHVHSSGTLHGHLHGGGFEALGAWAGVLGGEIAPVGRDWALDGRRVRTHRLATTWRDVRVEVVVVVPVGAAAAGEQVAA
ncbi:hypothetical protein ACFSJS_22765 [Streptomyces desertarenae]|uniref:Transcriptional regulator n=1 Tax=Streptomyces desertarenae TaxID=2666184 RepID=A0ABW4PSQ2_9ACTN